MDSPDPADYLSFTADFADPTLVAVYDELPLWSALFGALLLRHVPLRRGATALDLGCGTGFPLLELAQRLGPSSKVYGVDSWAAALGRARQKATAWGMANVELIADDAARLPLPDEHVDLIVSNLGVNNFQDPAAVLRECRRVARPGAALALTSNLQGHMREFYEIFLTVLSELGKHAEMQSLREHIAHRATVERITRQLTSAGFDVNRVIEESTVLRYADGGAFLRHWFIKLGFLDAWKQVLSPADQTEIFARLEAALDRHAAERGELSLTIPMAYVEAIARAP